MTDKKNTGSYYTPKILSDFLSNHIIQKYIKGTEISILEPSCGDGQFVSSFFDNLYDCEIENIELDLFDIDKKELDKAIKNVPITDRIGLNYYGKDYLKSSLNNRKTYSLIIGNPPYIKKRNLQNHQITVCEDVHQKAKKFSTEINSISTIKNIWTAFVEASIMSLNDNGVLCFVIPAEILQVKYAKELRALIVDELDRVEVFAFNELIFDGIQQDVVALIGVKGIQNIKEHGFSFYQVDELSDLKEPKFTEKHSNIHRTTLDKWTNYILSDEELDFVDKKRNEYNSIRTYCDKAQVGIVSAANDYFILTDKELKQNELTRFRSLIKPILPKGALIPNVANFTNLDFNILKSKDVKVNFLLFPNLPKAELNKKIVNYLNRGEEKKEDNTGELHKRYKMTLRDNWYHVPSTWLSEGLFIKRCHKYPKMFVNTANCHATDSFYRIITKNQYNIRNLVFSFYNSLTFVLAELEGRFYGGGVLELTPNEFKDMSIPYCENISEEQFNALDEMLRNDVDIQEILSFTNSILIPHLNTSKLEEIRIKLFNRRIKKTTKEQDIDFEIFPLEQNKIKEETQNVLAS